MVRDSGLAEPEARRPKPNLAISVRVLHHSLLVTRYWILGTGYSFFPRFTLHKRRFTRPQAAPLEFPNVHLRPLFAVGIMGLGFLSSIGAFRRFILQVVVRTVRPLAYRPMRHNVNCGLWISDCGIRRKT